MDGIAHDVVAEVVRFAIDGAGLDAAGHPDGETMEDYFSVKMEIRSSFQGPTRNPHGNLAIQAPPTCELSLLHGLILKLSSS